MHVLQQYTAHTHNISTVHVLSAHMVTCVCDESSDTLIHVWPIHPSTKVLLLCLCVYAFSCHSSFKFTQTVSLFSLPFNHNASVSLVISPFFCNSYHMAIHSFPPSFSLPSNRSLKQPINSLTCIPFVFTDITPHGVVHCAVKHYLN